MVNITRKNYEITRKHDKIPRKKGKKLPEMLLGIIIKLTERVVKLPKRNC